MNKTDRQAALEYHEFPAPGKISVTASKPLVTQRDLALAYTPGVAVACEEIATDPAQAFRYTSRAVRRDRGRRRVPRLVRRWCADRADGREMGPRPLILALANPTPEIFPEAACAVRDDAVIATGRSDYPNQVSNVLCFPYIFRGAPDVGATSITRRMEIAAVHAIANLAKEEPNDAVAAAYGVYDLAFGPKYLIPKPFDSRLIVRIAPAVAQAAMDDGVAARPFADFAAYKDQLQQFVYHSGAFMKPLFAAAKQFTRDGGKARIVFAEGEGERVLRAVQVIVDEKLAHPILVGRPEVLLAHIEKFGLRLRLGEDVEVTSPDYDERFHQYWTAQIKTGAGSNVAVGPFLLGVNAPVNILTSRSTVRRIVNMAALTVLQTNRD